ncbi:hypothetical protein ANN_09737 [Periplaneta americana]|uniref:Histone-lysine N-methyltransferase SETMAR n=1 Tax=Periplaneta americana TaxID=6978 RepID=A0ABQ8TM44_PERAM|nr:hypothetical protein ANN_09737 [Periplaneta americana]
MSPGSSTESYPAFASIGLRENPGKNLNQVTCPDRDSNPGHLVSQPDALTVTPQCYCYRSCSSVTADYDSDFLRKKLRPNFRQNRPKLLESGALLLHNNARPHNSESVRHVLTDYNIGKHSHPPYSPDMSPPDYDLFPKLKNPLQGQLFATLNDLNTAVTRRIRELNFRGEFNSIQQLP